MSLHLSFAVLLAFVFVLAASTPFRPRGSDSIAPYSNATSTDATTAAAVSPLETSTSASPASASSSEHASYSIPGTGSTIVISSAQSARPSLSALGTGGSSIIISKDDNGPSQSSNRPSALPGTGSVVIPSGGRPLPSGIVPYPISGTGAGGKYQSSGSGPRPTGYPPYPIAGTGSGAFPLGSGGRPRPTGYPPYPIGSGTGIITKNNGGFPRPTDRASSAATGNATANATITASGNSTFGACTVNIPQANLDWWYLATYEYPIGTLTTRWDSSNYTFTDNGVYVTMIPNEVPFDITSAISTDYAYTMSLSWDADYNETWTYFEPYTVIPAAASTFIVTQTVALPLPSGNVVPKTATSSYFIDEDDLGPATYAITAATGTAYVATSSAPVLYFSAYEVESAIKIRGDDGQISSSRTTSTVTLPTPYAYEYELDGVENLATATAPVPQEFLAQIPQNCTAGTFEAVVTVLIVEILVYINFPGVVPFIVHIESSVLGFDSSPTTTGNDVAVASVGSNPTTTDTSLAKWMTPHIEASVSSLGAFSRAGNGNNNHDSDSSTADDNAQPSSGGQNGNVGGGSGSSGNSGNAQSSNPDSTLHSVGTVGSQTIKVGASSVVVIGSQTVAPGQAVTISGTPVSVDPSATAIVIAGSTSALPQVQPAETQGSSPPVITIGSATFTPNAATQYSIASGQVLTAGGVATLSGGTVVSLAPSASYVVVGGSTQILQTAATAAVTSVPQIVVGGSTIAAAAGTGTSFVIAGQTLSPGQVITVAGGTTISLNAAANTVVVNGNTEAVQVTPVTAAPILNLGSTQVAGNAGGTFVVAGQTLTPGGVITVSGTTISLSPAGTQVVINGNTQQVAWGQATAAPVLTLGDSQITAVAGSTFIVDGKILTPGGVIIDNGVTISLGPSASYAVINGVTQTLSNAGAQITPPPLTVGNTVFNARPGSGETYVIGGQTLTPGGVVVYQGSTISLSPDGTAVYVNGQSTNLFSSGPITDAPLLTIGGDVLGGRSGTYVIDGQTLTPGGVITVDGSTISLSPGATALVINGKTTQLSTGPVTAGPLLTIGDSVYGPQSGDVYVIHGQTLTEGGSIVVDGTTISLAQGATAIVVNGKTTFIGTGPITNPPLLTIGSHTYTANSGTTFVIDGQTLTPGGVITVDGTTISLSPGATELVYGSGGHSTTEMLFPATATAKTTTTTSGWGDKASAGATGVVVQAPATATSTKKKGAANNVQPHGLEAWALSLLIGFLGLVFG